MRFVKILRLETFHMPWAPRHPPVGKMLDMHEADAEELQDVSDILCSRRRLADE